MILLPPKSTLFPYTTLFRSFALLQNPTLLFSCDCALFAETPWRRGVTLFGSRSRRMPRAVSGRVLWRRDRERSEEHTSESSHEWISYAVFCLKKKKKTKTTA